MKSGSSLTIPKKPIRAARSGSGIFSAPDDLNEILSLYTRVTQKTLLISKTLGIEGRKLLTPEDDYEALKEFHHDYEGTRTAVEEMHLAYQAMLEADPELEGRLTRFPGAIFSGRKRPAKGVRSVFFCYALPALGQEAEGVHGGGRHDPLVLSTTSTARPSLMSPVRSLRASARNPRHHGAASRRRRRFSTVRKTGRSTHQEELPEARGRPVLGLGRG